MLKLQKARKDHECDLCHNKIPKGENYWREFNADSYTTRKEHTNCLLYDKNGKINNV
jgi:hypothetical protein